MHRPAFSTLAALALAWVLVTGCATGDATGDPPPNTAMSATAPSDTEAPRDRTRVLLLGGSYLRSVAPALVYGLGSAGIEVLDATETGLYAHYLDELLYDWRTEYEAYLDALRPDVVVLSIPIGLEAFQYCNLGGKDEFNACMDERLATKSTESARAIAAFFAERGVELVFLGDLSRWPGSGRYDGRTTDVDQIADTGMEKEEAILETVFGEFGFPFVSVRDSLFGNRAQYWVQEPDGRWYNWRFPEKMNMHVCPRGAAHVAVELAAHLDPPVPLSMEDDWVDGEWTRDSWYLWAGCSLESAPFPRYLPVTYSDEEIGRTSTAGYTDEVRDVIVPGDPETCALLAPTVVARAVAATHFDDADRWSAGTLAVPRWQNIALVFEERMQWRGGCRHSPAYYDHPVQADRAITVVEWEQSRAEIEAAFAATGHTLYSTTPSGAAVYALPVEASMFSFEGFDVPVAILVTVADRVVTIHAPRWPTIDALEELFAFNDVDQPTERRLLDWLETELPGEIAMALSEMADALDID